MGTYTKAKTPKQQRHTASRSRSHREDKSLGAVRRKTTFLPVPASDRASPTRDFSRLRAWEFAMICGRWTQCQDPEEYADFVEAEAKKRSWFLDETQRGGKTITMKRRVRAAVELLTTTFSPPLADYIAEEIAGGRNPEPQIAAIVKRWFSDVQRLLSEQRFVIGLAFHQDTNVPHLDVACSRQSGDGGRIGRAGLQMAGPWCVGTDRQVRFGAEISSQKKAQLKRSVANFRQRYGESSVPLDVQLARSLDRSADAVLGERLQPYKKAYADSVPELERKHAQAKLDELDRARDRLLKDLQEPEVVSDIINPLRI